MKELSRRSRAARHFQFHGELSASRRTATATSTTPILSPARRRKPARYILQHINRNVFRDPAAVMQNIERVTAHLRDQSFMLWQESRKVAFSWGKSHRDTSGSLIAALNLL